MNHPLDDMMTMKVRKLYGVETHLLGALGVYSGLAGDDRLAKILQSHRQQTRLHVQRLQEARIARGWAFGAVAWPRGEATLARVRRSLRGAAPGAGMDARIARLALRAKGWEIDGYRAAAELARETEDEESAASFEQALVEERAAEQELIALVAVGVRAAAWAVFANP